MFETVSPIQRDVLIITVAIIRYMKYQLKKDIHIHAPLAHIQIRDSHFIQLCGQPRTQTAAGSFISTRIPYILSTDNDVSSNTNGADKVCKMPT
jgi:hypothetical protein